MSPEYLAKLFCLDHWDEDEDPIQAKETDTQLSEHDNAILEEMVHSPLSINVLEYNECAPEPNVDRSTFISTANIFRGPGSFNLNIDINYFPVRKCLLDPVAAMNSMPINIARLIQIDLRQLTPLKGITFSMADGTERSPHGLARDVPIEIEGRFMRIDFMITDATNEAQVLLGRPFMFMTHAKLDYGTMSVELLVNEE